MKLRPAVVTDIPLLKAWDENPYVIDATGEDSDYDWSEEIPRTADWGELLIAEEGGRPIGFMEIIDPAREPTRYWGDYRSARAQYPCAPVLRKARVQVRRNPDLRKRSLRHLSTRTS